ncbi:hypothetical protein AB0C77_23370 [Streptomyces sp. NPDC048629]|uniref:DUF6907 domain-containing protein n=1 Tax=Streptomyces sp. NPDC048629 TaxID=3154824 RepID=UPI0034192A81
MKTLPASLPAAFLSGVPSQPKASRVSLTKAAAAEAQLQSLLDEYGITMERVSYVEPDYMKTGSNFLGDLHLYLGMRVDAEAAIRYVQAFIERDGVPPMAHNPEHSSNRPRVRLVPVLVGTRDRVQTAYVECPWWCTEHHDERIGSLDDLVHNSGGSHAQVETLTDDLYDLTAQIATDPASSDERLRSAHIQLGGLVDDAALTPDMADEVADELITLASQMRQQAAIARRFNAGGAA